MADVKISGLSSGAVINGSELVPVVQSGTTVRTTVSAFSTYINSSIRSIAAGGTGQSNQQAALNNLTSIGVANPGDILTASGGNAQWAAAPTGVTYAAINAAINAASGSFLFTDATQQVVARSGWSYDTTTLGYNIVTAIAPNNLGGQNLHNKTLNFSPLQNSPNESWHMHNWAMNFDTTSSGFSQGLNLTSSVINAVISHQGTGSIGTVAFLNFGAQIGNGTDPISFGGVNVALASLQVAANVTWNNSLQGYGFQPNVSASAIAGTNNYVNAFYDNATIGVSVKGYTSINLAPTIASIANNNGFNGININPTITTLTGNANATMINIAGTVTTLGTGGMTGVNLNPNIVSLTQNSIGINVSGQSTSGTADWTGVNVFTSGITTTGAKKGLQVNVGNGRLDSAVEATGHCNLSSTFEVVNGLGQQYGHVVGGEIRLPNSAAITTTDVFGNNIGFTINLGNSGSSFTSSSPVSLTSVGFVGQVLGDGDADIINLCLDGYNPVVNGTVGRINNFNAIVIPNSGTGTITESVLYHGDAPFGAAGVSTWGVRIEDATNAGIENFFTRLAIGTSSKKVANGSVALEIGGTTSAFVSSVLTTTQRNALTVVKGMIVFNDTTSKFQGYDGSTWQDFH